jgi:hypothetical protein
MADKTFRCPLHIVQADTDTNLLDNLFHSVNPNLQSSKLFGDLTLLEYFALMLSSMASMLRFEKSSGAICTKSAIFV